jgi:hypothetical protein
MNTNEDIARFLEWRQEISGRSGYPMPQLLDAEAGTFAEVCDECDAVLALLKVVDHGEAVEITETVEGMRHRQRGARWN